jgi:Fe-S-cluster containining protein
MDGLRFSCRRCSSCCRYESGYVFLSQKDLLLLSAACKMKYIDFVKIYCRWVPGGEGETLSLRETSCYDCIFWKDGCSVYDSRPLQCRSFPFWGSILGSPKAWDIAKTGCPGMDSGLFHTGKEIEACLAEQEAEPHIVRKTRQAGRIRC